jgi:hypothetical protein
MADDPKKKNISIGRKRGASVLCTMCVDPKDEEGEQLRRLRALLAPVVRFEQHEDRLKLYHETWARLNPGGGDMWKTLRSGIETKFRAVICEQLSNEVTTKPIPPFSFMHYSQMLLELLDVFLKGLDDYIDMRKVRGSIDLLAEDERLVLQKSMRHSRATLAQDWLDVLLFMHAVPQRVDDRWDALDHESDVTWFRGHCKVYQENAELAAFLRDCAVAVLLVRHLHAAREVRVLLACYALYEFIEERGLQA